MILDFDDISKAMIVKDTLKRNGVAIKFFPNQLLTSPEIIKSNKLSTHRIEINDNDSQKAKTILSKYCQEK